MNEFECYVVPRKKKVDTFPPRSKKYGLVKVVGT